MRVLLDTTYCRRAPYSGTAVYLGRLQEALGELEGVEAIAVANERRQPPAGGGLGSVRNLVSDAWWASVELPRRAKARDAEVIHHPLPAIAPRASRAQVITVLDLAFERLPEHFAWGYRTFAHYTHRAAALAAGAVICISESTAADVRSLWGVSPERIVVAPLGPGQGFKARIADGPPQHFLYVGDGEPRKNVALLLSAYRGYRERADRPLELVLAGSAQAQGPGIVLEPGPSPERLAELYADAAALVHPSLYEGFGLTPLEAMSVGTPVLAARSPGVSEVCAEAVLYGDANDPRSFATAMIRLASDRGLREDLAARGRERAAEFSWAACARRHAEAYSLALRA